MIADKDEHIKTILSVIPEKPGCYQYFDENGTMKTDWLTLDENKFYLYPIADGTRGRMLTGWQKIGDNWYYFHEESDGNKGVLARRTKIGNYYVNSDGVWAK